MQLYAGTITEMLFHLGSIISLKYRVQAYNHSRFMEDYFCEAGQEKAPFFLV